MDPPPPAMSTRLPLMPTAAILWQVLGAGLRETKTAGNDQMRCRCQCVDAPLRRDSPIHGADVIGERRRPRYHLARAGIRARRTAIGTTTFAERAT